MNKQEKKSGYITLLIIIIIGSLSMVLALSFSAWTYFNIKNEQDYQNQQKSKSLADACIEAALVQIRTTPSYSGTATISVSANNCTYTVTNLGAENRRIDSTATIFENTKKVQCVIDKINPKINIVSWQEVASF